MPKGSINFNVFGKVLIEGFELETMGQRPRLFSTSTAYYDVRTILVFKL